MIDEKKLIEEMAEEIESCYGRETELSKKAREYLSQPKLLYSSGNKQWEYIEYITGRIIQCLILILIVMMTVKKML